MAEGEGGEEEEEEAVEIPQTPEPREWVCLGSDLEILEQQVTNSRDLVSRALVWKRESCENCTIERDWSRGWPSLVCQPYSL